MIQLRNLTRKHRTPNPQKTASSDTQGWDWSLVILGWLLLITVTRRLLVTGWDEELYRVAYVVNLAFLLGLLLGRSQSRRLSLFLLSLGYGSVIIAWQLGEIQTAGVLWSEKFNALLLRLTLTFERLLNRQPVYDSLFFLLSIMALFWALGVSAGYSLVRSQNALPILVPPFLTLLTIHSYDTLTPTRSGYFHWFSFFAVLLLFRLAYLRREKEWRERQFYVSSQLASEAFRSTLGIVLSLLVFSLVLPASEAQFQALVRSWEKIKEPFHSLEEHFTNLFASLPRTTFRRPDPYERSLVLGRGAELSEQEIFTVIAEDEIPPEARLFWRVRVYDHYENGQWTSSQLTTQALDPGSLHSRLPSYPERPHTLYSFTFYLHQPIFLLALPSQPYWTNLAVKAEYVENPDHSIDLFALQPKNPLKDGQVYRAHSLPNTLTADQLESAGEDYPPWIAERYLQLPPDLSQRTRALAEELTRDLATPYGKAVAIIEYLRTHLSYVETLEELPTDRELLDWFLFEHKKGFCNYYASAAVMLLRSAGIPARLAVGYATGVPLEEVQTPKAYLVRERDAHAWPEVFFPEIGWVEFEPTPAQPPLVYPQQQDITAAQGRASISPPSLQTILRQIHEEAETSPRSSHPLSGVLLLLFLILGAVSLSLRLAMQKAAQTHRQLPEILEEQMRSLGLSPSLLFGEWRQHSKPSPTTKSYTSINAALNILRYPPPAYYTPLERARLLSQLLPEAKSEIEQVAQAYQNGIYGNPSSPEKQTGLPTSKILRLAWRKRLHNELQRVLQRGKELLIGFRK